MQKYPIGIQDFPKLREENYLYVDKTKDIFNLISQGKYYFLSRPRRFGKSLLISTLETIFLGKKELFEGLWITDKMEWESRPVIRLDFSKMDYVEDNLAPAIIEELKNHASKFKIEIKGNTPKKVFIELLTKLSEEKSVAILIDEYDKPIIDYLGENQLAQAQKNREVLKQFYSAVKSMDAHIHFFFLTGVSKFSKVSIFSDLNHLEDITMSPQTHALVGYTQTELETYFATEIDELAKREKISRSDMIQKIKRWYNGYRWDEEEETLYNSFSVLHLMKQKRFNNFWFETGTPTFLLKLLRNKQLFKMDNVEVDAINIKSYQIENLDVYTLLFQTGYLTIANRPNRFFYELKYPNQEVAESFEQYLLNHYSEKNNTSSICYRMAQAFHKNALEDVEEQFKILLANIPYDMFEAKQEKYYQAIFYLALKLTGYHIEVEIKTNKGRIDAVVQNEDSIFIVEFKVNKSADEAIQQIKDTKYHEKYQNQNKKICLIGMNCYDKTIKEWKTEWL